MREYMAYVAGWLCLTVTMVGYAQQGPREAAPATAALEAAPVAHSLQMSVTGLPRRGESL